MVVDGVASPYVDVGSGVPLGSVIGPLLFFIRVSDIDFKLKYSQAASFADDTRLTMKISSSSDCTDFQRDLAFIYEWAESNRMSFHESKFVHMRYSHPTASRHLYTSRPRTGTWHRCSLLAKFRF